MVNIREIEVLLDSPIAFHRVFAGVADGALPGLWLSQVFYWSKKYKNDPERNGEFYCSHKDWFDQIGMTRSEVDTARKKVLGLGLIEEARKGVPGKIWTRIKWDNFASAVNKWLSEQEDMSQCGIQAKCNAETPQSALPKGRKVQHQKPAKQPAEKPQSTTETTTETSPKITTTSPVVDKLISMGISSSKATVLALKVSSADVDAAERDLAVELGRSSQITNKAGWLVWRLESGEYQPPVDERSQKRSLDASTRRIRNLQLTSEGRIYLQEVRTAIDSMSDSDFIKLAITAANSSASTMAGETKEDLLGNLLKSNQMLCERVHRLLSKQQPAG
jgi:hypothetical protein